MNKNRDVAYLQNFGLRLKELRLSKGYTQSLFADKCNIERSQIVRLEKGLINSNYLNFKNISQYLRNRFARIS